LFLLKLVEFLGPYLTRFECFHSFLLPLLSTSLDYTKTILACLFRNVDGRFQIYKATNSKWLNDLARVWNERSSNLKWQGNEHGIWWDLNWVIFLSLMLFSQVNQSHLLTNAHPQRKTSKKIWHSEEDGDLTWTNIYQVTNNHPKRTWKYTCGTAKPKYVSFMAFHNLSTMSSMIHNRISTTLKWPPFQMATTIESWALPTVADRNTYEDVHQVFLAFPIVSVGISWFSWELSCTNPLCYRKHWDWWSTCLVPPPNRAPPSRKIRKFPGKVFAVIPVWCPFLCSLHTRNVVTSDQNE